MNIKSKSVIKRYFFLSILFGILMGIVFPFYSEIFVTYKSNLLRLYYFGSCIIAGIFVGFFAFYIGKLTILKFFSSLSKAFDDISKGNINLSLDISSDDEFGAISEKFNGVFKKMCHTVSDVHKNVDDLRDIEMSMSKATSLLAANMQEQSAIIGEITESLSLLAGEIEGISKENEKQSDRLKNHVTLVERLSSLQRENMALVRNAGKLSKNSADNIQNTQTAINSLNLSMTRIQDNSGQMSKIVDIINNISDKINLLAINAAIESARAGEHGRGFAVVSSEISKLAEQTASNVKNITEQIEKSNIEFQTAEQNFKLTNKSIQMIIYNVREINEIIDEILFGKGIIANVSENTNKETEIINESSLFIKESSSDQSKTINEIAHAFSDLNNIFLKNVRESESIKNYARKNKVISESLEQGVSFFRI